MAHRYLSAATAAIHAGASSSPISEPTEFQLVIRRLLRMPTCSETQLSADDAQEALQTITEYLDGVEAHKRLRKLERLAEYLPPSFSAVLLRAREEVTP